MSNQIFDDKLEAGLHEAIEIGTRWNFIIALVARIDVFNPIRLNRVSHIIINSIVGTALGVAGWKKRSTGTTIFEPDANATNMPMFTVNNTVWMRNVKQKSMPGRQKKKWKMFAGNCRTIWTSWRVREIQSARCICTNQIPKLSVHIRLTLISEHLVRRIDKEYSSQLEVWTGLPLCTKRSKEKKFNQSGGWLGSFPLFPDSVNKIS